MLEIACFNPASAGTAADGGADRIELCADYAAGGVTPSFDDLIGTLKATTLPINVMIRPRGGNFVYTTLEFHQMKLELLNFKPHADGFVFGILDDHNRVDEDRNRELVTMAAPLPCTFHRAFDNITDHDEAVEALVRCGFTSILTSGGNADAVSGAGEVARLQREFGNQINFIIGGGVRSTNIEALYQQTKVPWYHSAALTQPGEAADKGEVRDMQSVLNSKSTKRFVFKG